MVEMRDEPEDKMTPLSYTRSPILSFGVAFLLIIIGLISFFYAGGSQTIKSGWVGAFRSSMSLEVVPENTIIPADGSSQIYVDVIAKNKKGQLLDGTGITAALTQGDIDLTNSPVTPAGSSKRFLIRASHQPQTALITFTFQGLNQVLTLEAFDPQPPAIPTLKAPSDGAILSTATPTISGQAPPESQVEIYIDDTLNTITPTDADGTFVAALEQALSQGRHKITIASINRYGIRSSFNNPTSIDIQTPDPEIDLANIRLRPNPAPASGISYIFIPVSANTKSVTVVLEKTNYALTDRHDSSIFSGALRTPAAAGVYRISAIITNQGGDSILANNIVALRVQ